MALPRLKPIRCWMIGLLAVLMHGPFVLGSECVEEDECCSSSHGRPTTLFRWAGDYSYPDANEERPLASDRPDFTEASSTVGLGYRQVEMGYTYFDDDDGVTRLRAHSFPETLFRIGMFADWFEARVAWNYGIERERTGDVTSVLEGSQDLYLGVKLALTEQYELLPEMALMPQMTVPLGSELSQEEVLPGLSWLYGWDLTERFTAAGSTQVNRRIDDADEPYSQFAQSFTFGVVWTDKLKSYTEWFAFFPHASDVTPVEHYLDGGFTYLAAENLQFDIRAGMGLNEAAVDFFTGAGLVVRF